MPRLIDMFDDSSEDEKDTRPSKGGGGMAPSPAAQFAPRSEGHGHAYTAQAFVGHGRSSASGFAASDRVVQEATDLFKESLRKHSASFSLSPSGQDGPSRSIRSSVPEYFGDSFEESGRERSQTFPLQQRQGNRRLLRRGSMPDWALDEADDIFGASSGSGSHLMDSSKLMFDAMDFAPNAGTMTGLPQNSHSLSSSPQTRESRGSPSKLSSQGPETPPQGTGQRHHAGESTHAQGRNSMADSGRGSLDCSTSPGSRSPEPYPQGRRSPRLEHGVTQAAELYDLMMQTGSWNMPADSQARAGDADVEAMFASMRQRHLARPHDRWDGLPASRGHAHAAWTSPTESSREAGLRQHGPENMPMANSTPSIYGTPSELSTTAAASEECPGPPSIANSLFDSLDRNRDGVISRAEFRAALGGVATERPSSPGRSSIRSEELDGQQHPTAMATAAGAEGVSANMGVPPGHEQQKRPRRSSLEAARHAEAAAAAKAAMDAELEEKLQHLASSVGEAGFEEATLAAEELRSAISVRQRHLAEHRSRMSQSVVVERLREELAAATKRSHGLLAAVETGNVQLQQLQAKLTEVQQSGHAQQPASDTEDSLRAGLAEARRECNLAEERIAQANEAAEELQARSQQINIASGKLHEELHTAAANLEMQKQRLLDGTPGTLQREDAGSPNTRLRKKQVAENKRKLAKAEAEASRVEAQVFEVSGAASSLREEAAELEREVARLHEEREAGMRRTLERDAARAALWGQLAALASVGVGASSSTSLSTEADLTELAEQVGKSWATARRNNEMLHLRSERCVAERLECERMHAQLTQDLAGARQSANHAATAFAAAERELAGRESEHRGQQRRWAGEIAIAKSECTLLREARGEWQKARPQLANLIDELRTGNREGNSSHQELVKHVSGLRCKVDRRRQLGGPAQADGGKLPSSPRQLHMYPPEPEEDAPRWDLVHSEKRGISLAAQADSVDPGGQSLSGAGFKQVVDENDTLHKRVLALEDEKANLIREQEKFIQYVATKVEPLRRAMALAN